MGREQTGHPTARSRLRMPHHAWMSGQPATNTQAMDGGSTWSGWLSASSAGSDGATSYQAATAGSMSFNRDSGTQNKIKFKIDDVVGNTGESDEYTVNIDAADPTAPMISPPTNPDGGVGAT